MLTADECVFKNIHVLDFDYQPKLIRYRENHQFAIANCIKPLFKNQKGENVLVYGSSGIGKTLACKNIIKELEEETDSITPIYVNCWQHNTTYKIALYICEQLNYPFTNNKKGVELFKEIADRINKSSAVFVFDEIDKAEDLDFLYTITEHILRYSIILITNHKGKLLSSIDNRIRSRLFLECVEFKKYNLEETRGILKERVDHAFCKGCFENDSFAFAVDQTYDRGDIRSGLLILLKAGKYADNLSSKYVKLDHVKKILDKIDKYAIKGSSDLDEPTRNILDLVKKKNGETIPALFKAYQEVNGDLGYRSFYRRIKALELNKYIAVTKVFGGKKGNTSKVEYLSL
ncbi:AAA family ATPase [Candidatus Woesearchaeota archaeon]|nr:AAA family ATPase [Candidatus Woesearchaeota archaeon]